MSAKINLLLNILSEKVRDNRELSKTRYSITEIFLCVFVGVLVGCKGWDDIEIFCGSKLLALQQILPFKNGVPGHDTIRRFCERLDNSVFQSIFIEWVKMAFGDKLKNQLIHLDGKTLKGSKFNGNKAIHIMNMYCSELGISVAALEVDGKTNEITAMQDILEMFEIKGCIITADALNCQKAIVQKIDNKEASYMLAVKQNQATLYWQIVEKFKTTDAESFETYQISEKGHGRLEAREYKVYKNIATILEGKKWQGLATVVQVTSTRIFKDKESVETRYFISNIKELSAKRASVIIRDHWLIENHLHWTLDIAFGEDDCRITKNAAKNLSFVRKIALNALNMIERDKKRQSIPSLQRRMAYYNDFFEGVIKVLMG